MSKILLQSIIANKKIQGDPFMYIGSIVDSDSGYLEPHLYMSQTELEAVMPDFSYNQMYKNFIGYQIPVCLLPIITPESNYNRCSLRLNKTDSIISSCNPKYKKDYHYRNYYLQDSIANEDYQGILNDQLKLGWIVDFTDVDIDDLVYIPNKNYVGGQYFIFQVYSQYKDFDKTIEIQFNNIYGNSISTSEFNNQYSIKIGLEKSEMNKCNDPKLAVVEDLIRKINNNLTIINNGSGLHINDILHAYSLKDLIITFINRNVNNNDIYEDQFGNQVYLDEWKSNLIKLSYIEDWWFESNRNIGDRLSKILDKFDGYNTKLKKEDLLKEVDSEFNNNYSILITTNTPVKLFRKTNLSKLNIYSLDNFTQDKLSKLTDNEKVVEFYSKIKGSTGSDISIEIKTIDFHEDLYDITISNGLIYENYTVRLHDVDDTLDSIYITDINKTSQLVEIYLYNYKLQYGPLEDQWYWIDDLYYNEYVEGRLEYLYDGEEIGYHLNRVRDKSELKLIPGKYKLNRVTSEEYTYEDLNNSIEIFKESNYYPDLFMVDWIPNNPPYLNKILKSLDWTKDSDDSLFSQALINLVGYQLNKEWKVGSINQLKSYPDANNRLLYTYDYIYINGIKFPLSYIYALNILHQTYLQINIDNFYYDPMSLRETNYIKIISYLNDKFHNTESTNNWFGEWYIKLVSGNQCILEFYRLNRVNDHWTHEYRSVYGILSNIYKDVIYLVDTKTELEQIEDIINQGYELKSENSDLLNYHGFHFETVLNDLIDNKINYLKYDNINYFYETLREPIGQNSIFIIRFITSKFTREVYKIKSELTGIGLETARHKILSKVSLIKSKFNLIEDVDTSIEYSDNNYNKLNITFTVKLKSIVNKEYKVNFILNIG